MYSRHLETSDSAGDSMHKIESIWSESTSSQKARRNWLKALGLGIISAFAGKSALQLLAQNSNQKTGARKPIQLHMYIEVKSGKGLELEKLYHSAYMPAIKVQD